MTQVLGPESSLLIYLSVQDFLLLGGYYTFYANTQDKWVCGDINAGLCTGCVNSIMYSSLLSLESTGCSPHRAPGLGGIPTSGLLYECLCVFDFKIILLVSSTTVCPKWGEPGLWPPRCHLLPS